MVSTTADEQWALQFVLHQTLETVLLNNPLNLLKLSEVFFPRNFLVSPVSVQVTYNLTCQEPGNCSLQTKDVNDDGNYTFFHLLGHFCVLIQWMTELQSIFWTHLH